MLRKQNWSPWQAPLKDGNYVILSTKTKQNKKMKFECDDKVNNHMS